MLDTKRCINCDKEFFSNVKKKVFCTKKCGQSYRRRNVYKSRYENPYYSTLRGYLKHLLCLRKDKRSDLSLEFLEKLYTLQNGKCSLTGLDMTTIRGKGKVSTNLSIDRIDSSKGYTKDNVQLVCVFANLIKMDKSLDELYDFCERVLKNRSKH